MKLAQRWIDRISKSIPVAEMVGQRIVLIDTSGLRGISTLEKTKNIYCINEKNDIIWQINPSVGVKEKTDCFVSLGEIHSNIVAERFFGDEFDLNIKDGKAIHTGWHK